MSVDTAIEAIKQDITDEKAKRSVRLGLLEIIVKAQDFGECPWCDCAIGASHYHWNSSCPFKNMTRIMDEAL